MSNRTETAIRAYRIPVPTEPLIDGKLTDSCWQHAEVATAFHACGAEHAVDPSPRAQIAYDDEHLYVALWCPLKDARAVEKAVNLKPDQLFVGPTAQIFVDPYMGHRRPAGLDEDRGERFYNHRWPKIFRFAVNSANGRHGELLGLPWYRVPWRSQTHVGDGFWTAELAIPLPSLSFFEQDTIGGVPAWSRQWAINFAVDECWWVPQLHASGFPTDYGLLSDLEVDLERHQWVVMHGFGPRMMGRVPLAASLGNKTGHKRIVKVRAEDFTDETRDPPAFEPQYGTCRTRSVFGDRAGDASFEWTGDVWEVEDCASGRFTLPVDLPGRHVILLSVLEEDTDRVLAYRPLLLEDVQVGVPVWDRTFYMNEHSARLTVRFDHHLEGQPTVRCDLRRKDQPEVLQTRFACWARDHTAQATFCMQPLDIGDYAVTVTVSGYEQYPLVSNIQKLEYRPAAVQCTDLGVMLRDGEPFFAFGMYGATRALGHDEGFAAEYSGAGFTSFIMDSLDSNGYLELAERLAPFGLAPVAEISAHAELKGFYQGDYSWRELHDERIPIAREAVRKVAAHVGVNLLAWNTRDEPNELMYHMVRGFHDLTRQEDPYHPTMTTIFTAHLFPAYHDATDTLAADIYAIPPDGRISRPGESMGRAVEDMLGKPVIAVLAAFHPVENGKECADYRLCNRAELRCVTFHSILRGVTGVFFFCLEHHGQIYKRPGDTPPESEFGEYHPEVWEALKELAGHVKSVAPVLFSSPPENVRLKRIAPVAVETRLYHHDGADYLLAVNVRQQPSHDVKFSLEDATASSIELQEVDVLFENRKARIDDEYLVDDFDSYDVHLYRIMTTSR